MLPLLIASQDLALDQDHIGGSSSAASATNGGNVDVDRSFSSAPTEDEGDSYHSQLQNRKGPACVDIPTTPVLPAPVVSILRLFDDLRRPSHCGIDTQNTETQEIDISRQEYSLLWWLLGQGEDRGQNEEGLRPRALQPLGGIQTGPQPPKLAYLPLLWHEGIELSSVDELHDLGRWVLDSVRYEFRNVCDATVSNGHIKTRLSIRMPLYIHDKFSRNVGQLLQDSIRSHLPHKDVHAHNGFRCQFTDKFHQMMAVETQKKKRRGEGRSNSNQPGQTQAAPSPTLPQVQSQPLEPTGGPQTRSRSRSGIESQPSALAVEQGQCAAVGRVDHGDSEPAVHPSVQQRDEAEEIRYDEASPDVCVYIGDEATTLIPSVIVEVGFSHPLPFDRARSYIYGSDGQCRVVICLDIEYRDFDTRHQSYASILSSSEPSQDVQPCPPPYGLTLNLFRCKFEVAGQHDTYAPTHELRNIDVREGARLGKVLELKVVDLVDLDDDSETEKGGHCSEGQQHGPGGYGLVTIPYADIVSLLDETAWGQALRDNPSLRPSKKRKRELVARPFTASPEPGPTDSGRRALVKRRRASRTQK